MSGLLGVLLGNALAAAALALLAVAAQRWLRPRPVVAHALWAVVLLRLVAPPLWPVAILAWPQWPLALALPEPAASVAGARAIRPIVRTSSAATRGGAALDLRAEPAGATRLLPAVATSTSSSSGPAPSMIELLSGIVVLGALTVLGIGIWRSRQFRQLLAGGTPAPRSLQARGEELAARVGLARCPEIWLVPARISPMLWFGRSRPRILLPRELWADLCSEETDTLLVHELAHVRRRDHWVRLLELATTALFWWYPLAWWARARLRQVEERCCDEWVARLLPRSGRAYAEGLLKTLAFLSSDDRPLPAAATGARPLRDLESRLEEILMNRSTPRLAHHARTAMALAAVLGLTVFPTWAQRGDGPDGPPPAGSPRQAAPAQAAEESRRLVESREAIAVVTDAGDEAVDAAFVEAERKLRRQRLALQHESLQLEQKERVLRRSELELQAKRRETQVRQELARLQASLTTLRADGSAEERTHLQQQVEQTRQRLQLERQRIALEVDQLERIGRLEIEIRQRQLAVEAAEAAGQERESEALQAAVEELEAQREKVLVEIGGRQTELEGQLMASELACERERMELEHLDHGRELEQRAREMAAEAAGRQLEMQARQAEFAAREVERQARASEREALRAETQGRGQEARSPRPQAAALARQAEQRQQAAQGRNRQAALEAALKRRWAALELARTQGDGLQVATLEREIASLRQQLDEQIRGAK